MAQPTGGIDDSIHNPGMKSHARKPDVFSGDWKTLEKFLWDSNIYVKANIKDFPDDALKSQFLLSYIDGGEAESWKEFYINTNVRQADESYKWPKTKDLIKNLQANFMKEDEVEESLRKLETMKQGNQIAEEVVNEFQILKVQAKIDDSPLSVQMFQWVLNPSLAMKILTNIDKSNTLKDTKTAMNAIDKYGWFSKAIQYDQIYRDAWSMQREDWGGNYSNNNQTKNQNLWQAVQQSWRNDRPAPYRDPNAMDIDIITTTINTMTYDKWGKYLKKGLCFNCKQPGELIPEEYHKWLDIFDEKASERVPKPGPWDHAIKMKEGFEPKSFKAYALSPEELKLQKEFIDENLKKGYIRLFKSPMASSFFFVAKKEKGKLRPTQDYRYLNEWTVKNAYPMPRVDMVVDAVQSAQAVYFSKLDVAKAFNNVLIKDGDQ